jgi:hypothetical protein
MPTVVVKRFSWHINTLLLHSITGSIISSRYFAYQHCRYCLVQGEIPNEDQLNTPTGNTVIKTQQQSFNALNQSSPKKNSVSYLTTVFSSLPRSFHATPYSDHLKSPYKRVWRSRENLLEVFLTLWFFSLSTRAVLSMVPGPKLPKWSKTPPLRLLNTQTAERVNIRNYRC